MTIPAWFVGFFTCIGLNASWNLVRRGSALLLGVVVRNVVDAWGGRAISTEIVDELASVVLGVFLAIAMMSLNLIDFLNAVNITVFLNFLK